jgi:hypothetical protein
VKIAMAKFSYLQGMLLLDALLTSQGKLDSILFGVDRPDRVLPRHKRFNPGVKSRLNATGKILDVLLPKAADALQ